MADATASASSKFQLRLLGGFLLLALIGTGGYFWWRQQTISKLTDPVADLAQCLRDRGAVMYGVDTCENCQNQKKMFGEAFQLINYINCDFKQKTCDDKGITIYPVWLFGEKILIGTQSLAQLAKSSGCGAPRSLQSSSGRALQGDTSNILALSIPRAAWSF